MNILFVCTGNTCRSPMAEAILNDMAKKQKKEIAAKSAGIFAQEGSPAAENAIEVLKDMDIDISQSISTMISKELMEESDIILTMSDSHRNNLLLNFPMMKNKIFLLNQYALGINKDIEDPYGGSKFHYEIARNEIYKAIKKIIDNE